MFYWRKEVDVEPVRILLADDHVMFRRGLAALMEDRPDVTVVGEAGDGEEAVAFARKTAPHIILMDIGMPKMSGLDAIRQIKQEMPEIKIIVLTISDDDHDLIDAIQLGAQGYLFKNMEPAQLFDTIEAVGRGQVLLPQIVLDKIRRGLSPAPAREPKPPKTDVSLTPREKDILKRVASGETNKEIAAALYITESTVKLHLHNLLTKLHLQNRIQLAIYATQLEEAA